MKLIFLYSFFKLYIRIQLYYSIKEGRYIGKPTDLKGTDEIYLAAIKQNII